jgi:hypothetical protein
MLAMQFSKSTRTPSQLNSVSGHLSCPSKEFALASSAWAPQLLRIETDGRVTEKSTKSEEPRSETPILLLEMS